MKRKCKSLIFIVSMLLFCILIVPVTGIKAEAAGDAYANKESLAALTYVNPLYSDVISEEYIEQQAVDNITPFSETQYYDSVAEAGKQIRVQLKNRVETIAVGLKTTIQPSSEISHQVFDEALKHTGVATEGDYLKWQYGGWTVRISYYSQDGTYYITLTYDVTYYTDYDQERELDSAVSALLIQLDLNGKSDYEKIALIYDYICSNITYDYEHLSDTTYLRKHTAYAALVDKQAVCQGYAVLFYRLALEEGIDARVVTGTGNGGNHAWNIVKLGTKYYNVDATWDAGRSSYSYFLKGNSNFTDHEIGSYSSDIASGYMICDSDFEPDNIVEAPDAVTGLKIGGRASDALRLNWNKNETASGYIIEQYKNGKWTRIARIASNATLTYRVENLTAYTSYQFRVRAFGFDGATPLYSEYQYITGKTNPSAVTGLKIGGTAKDALRLNWNKNTGASGYIIEQYKNGAWTRIARIASNSTVTYRVEKLSASTTYQFRVQAFGFDGNTPLYSTYQTVSGTTSAAVTVKAPSAVTGLKIGGRATDALRLNWDKNSSASGYIIEQYKNGAWLRIARIASNSTITYRVEGLGASTIYQFRVQAFGFNGSTPLYSTYVNISGTTLPTAVTGLTIGGTAKDALRLNWNRNSSASGYIIEQHKNGVWTRIARIGSNSTTTYRVEGLNASTTYQFRVQSFGFDGNIPLYSSYQYINGTTNK